MTEFNPSATVARRAMQAVKHFGGHLECQQCGHTEPLRGKITRYLLTGWPMCCGYTMEWITKAQNDVRAGGTQQGKDAPE